MKKRNLLAAAAFIATAFVSTSTAGEFVPELNEPAFHGYNSWHAGKASVTLINKDAKKYTDLNDSTFHYGCKMEIRPGGGSQTPERWYVLGSAGSVDSKLWYQDTDGSWKNLSDDDGEDANYKAVIHVPQRFTNEAASKNIILQAGYYRTNKKDVYWHHADQYETADPQLNVPYLEVAPDGSMTRVSK